MCLQEVHMTRVLVAALVLVAGFGIAQASQPTRVSSKVETCQPNPQSAGRIDREPTQKEIARLEGSVGLLRRAVLLRLGHPWIIYRSDEKEEWVYVWGQKAFYVTFTDDRAVDACEGEDPTQTVYIRPCQPTF
jgi:hypothetical protein